MSPAPLNELYREVLFLPPQASSYARSLDTLHYVVLTTTMLAATLIALVAAYFAWRYSSSRPRRPADGRLTRQVEYALITLVLATFLAFWVIGFVQYVHIEEVPRAETVVYVTGKQWMWKFAHENGPDEAGHLTVPAHRPVKLVMTSRDVIHSFYVPAFRMKQDVIPGRYVTAWFEATETGTFDVFCAEYCGTSHATMHATVVVLAPDAYDEWLAGARNLTGESPIARGADLAAKKQCLGCHTTDGRAHVGPTWRGLYDSQVKLQDGRTVIADEAYLTRSMMNPREDVVAGFQPVMPTYQGQLEGPEAAAIVAYIKALANADTASAAGAPPQKTGTLEVKP